MAANVLELLCSSAKLERDRGVTELEKILLSQVSEESHREVESSIQMLLDDREASWEKKHGALMGCKCVVSHRHSHGINDEFVIIAREHAMRLVEDSESRVRLAAGNMIIRELLLLFVESACRY